MKLMRKINDDLKVLIIGMAILDLLAILISLFWGFNFSIILGLLVGYVYMSWNLFHLYQTVQKAVNKSTKKAKRTMLSNYIIRYLVLFIIIFICYEWQFISLIGVIIPLFYPKIVLGFNIILKKRREG